MESFENSHAHSKCLADVRAQGAEKVKKTSRKLLDLA